MKVEKRLSKRTRRNLLSYYSEDLKYLPAYSVVFAVVGVVFVVLVSGGFNPVLAGSVLIVDAVLSLVGYLRDKRALSVLGGKSKDVSATYNIVRMIRPPEAGLKNGFVMTFAVLVAYVVLGLVLGYFATTPMPKSEYVAEISKYTSAELFSMILKNNILVAFVVFSLTAFTGLVELGLLPIFTTSLRLGAVLQYGSPLGLLALFLGHHGAVELTAFGVVAFSGFVANTYFKSGDRKGFLLSACLLATGVAMIVVGAYVEAYYSAPAIVRALSG